MPIDFGKLGTAITQLQQAQATLRQVVSAATADPAIPMQTAKKPIMFHDSIQSVIHEINTFVTGNAPKPEPAAATAAAAVAPGPTPVPKTTA